MEFDDGHELGYNRCGYAEKCCEGFSSDLTDDSESGGDSKYGFTSRMLDRRPAARCLKRRYHGVFVDDDSGAAVPERRLRRRIYEQFELLRAVVPDLYSDEKASILIGAYEYIEKLQKLEAELRCELDIDSCGEDNVTSCCENEVRPSSREVGRQVRSGAGSQTSTSCSGCYCEHCSQPTVEVVRTEEGLKLHVECDTRPGLLLGMMEMLESSGLTVEQANIECAAQRLVFDGIGSEVEAGSESGGEVCELSLAAESSRHLTCVSAEVVGARLRSLIGDQTQGADKHRSEMARTSCTLT